MSTDRKMSALERVVAVSIGLVALGKVLYDQTTLIARPSQAAQKLLDERLERLKKSKVIAILRLKNLDKAMERVVELVDMGYQVILVSLTSTLVVMHLVVLIMICHTEANACE